MYFSLLRKNAGNICLIEILSHSFLFNIITFSFFKDFDYTKAEYLHRSVKYLQKHDELDSQNSANENENISYNGNLNSALKPIDTTTLHECFELFTQCEELTEENSWKCPKCSRKVANAFKKLCISSVPPILIIHLKRFFYKVCLLS